MLTKYESYVFTFSTGRSGTAYLASIFGCHHEAVPTIYQTMRKVCSTGNLDIASEYIKQTKFPAIESSWNGSKSIYAETSHMLCKGFLWSLYEILGNRMKVIRLRRDKAKTVNSFLKLQKFFRYPNYCMIATDELAINKMSKSDWDQLDLEQALGWYVDEIERQWQAFLTTIPKEQTIEINFEDILQESSQLAALEVFTGFPILRNNVGVKVNSYDSLLERIGLAPKTEISAPLL